MDYDELFSSGELREDRTLWVFTASIDLETVNSMTKWLIENAEGSYYSNCITAILDQFIAHRIISDKVKTNIFFFNHSIATQFKLIFTDWREVNLSEEDELMTKRIIRKLVPSV